MDANHKATSNVCTAQMSPINRLSGMLCTTRRMVKAFEAKHISLNEKYYPEDACSLQPTISASGKCDQEEPEEHQTGPRSEGSTR